MGIQYFNCGGHRLPAPTTQNIGCPSIRLWHHRSWAIQKISSLILYIFYIWGSLVKRYSRTLAIKLKDLGLLVRVDNVNSTAKLWMYHVWKIYCELGVHEWDWVHERLFMPEGIKNAHALNPIHEPRSYISLWRTILHTPLFCRFIPLLFHKYTNNHHLYCHFPRLKVPVKSATCLECTIQNRGVRCACTNALAHNNKYLWRASNFSA